MKKLGLITRLDLSEHEGDAITVHRPFSYDKTVLIEVEENGRRAVVTLTPFEVVQLSILLGQAASLILEETD